MLPDTTMKVGAVRFCDDGTVVAHPDTLKELLADGPHYSPEFILAMEAARGAPKAVE